MSTHLRAVLEELDDDTVHDAITALVTGLVRGMIEDVTARADDIVTGIVDSITGQLTAAAQCAPPSNADQMTESPVPVSRPAAKPQQSQDTVQRTCILCGRTGTRRFIETHAGWQCAPSSAEACARKAGAKAAPPRPAKPEYEHRNGRGLPGQHSDIRGGNSTPDVTPAPASDIPAKQFQPIVTPPAPKPGSPGVTARCQDCPRAFTLTGRPLELAVEMHELKHSHIVDVTEGATA